MPRPPRAAAPLRSKGPLPESCLENSSGGTSNRGAEAPLIGRFKVGVGGREIEIPPPPFLSHRFLSERKRCRRRPGRADAIRPYRAWRCGWAAAPGFSAAHDGSGLPVTLRVGRMAGSLSPGSAKNAAPGCARRLFFRLRPALAPLCAYPPRFFAVTLRLFATPGFPPTPGTNGQFANWPGLYPSLQSIRAAHDGSALLFILPEFSPPGQPWRTPCA